MKKSINLALGKKSVDTLLRKVFFATVAAFIISVVLSLGLIAYRLILKSSFDTLEAREQQINNQLLAQVEKRDKLLETKTRLAEVKKVISSRAPVTARIATLSEFVPFSSDVIGISGTDSDIQMTLESEDLASLGELIELKVAEITQDKKKGIKKIEMRSFGLNPNTLRYSITLGIDFI